MALPGQLSAGEFWDLRRGTGEFSLSLSHVDHLEQVATISRDKESPCPDFQWGGVTGRRSRSFHGSCQGCVYSASARSRQREKVCSPCFLPCVFVIFSDLLLSGEKGTILSIC